MSLGGEILKNYQSVILLAPLTITVPITATATTPVTTLGGMKYLAVEAIFVYGTSGGTNVNAYVQTSLDQGRTWIDIMNFIFTTSSLTKVNSTSIYQTSASPYAPVTPTDAAIAASTALPGILGDRIRLKYVSTGTYAGVTTLAVYAVAKG